MARSTKKISSVTGTECGGHGMKPGAGGARQSFMKLAAATATLTGAAMTAKMTAKAIAADGKSESESESCRSSARIGAICTSCSVGCTIAAENPVFAGIHSC